MKLQVVVILLAAALLSGCVDEKVYSPKDVEVMSQEFLDEGVKVTFNSMAEEKYYCPGVMYEQRGLQVFFTFVRCSVNKKDADVHLSAVPDENGNLSVVFPFPKNRERIELIDSLGKSLGEWKRETKEGSK